MTSARYVSSSHVNTVFGPVSALNYRIFPRSTPKRDVIIKRVEITTSYYSIMILDVDDYCQQAWSSPIPKSSPSLIPLPFKTYIYLY